MIALRKNLKALKSLLTPKVAILPIVKSDAYGHGLVPIARVLAQEGIFGFGISEISEGLKLKEAGLNLPIILLSGFEKDWLPEIVHHKFIPVVTEIWQLQLLASYTSAKGTQLPLHLKVDTGMNRFGLLDEEIEQALQILAQNPQLKLQGLMSHLCCSERADAPITIEQLLKFDIFQQKLVKYGFKPKYLHIANSGGIIFLPKSHYNMVRPGIALYGSYPLPEAERKIKLHPVMSFYTRIVSIKRLKPGSVLGYGPTFRAKAPMKVALVPVGYEDGYLRSLSNRGFAVIKGKRVPVVGTVSMKCIFLDVTNISDVRPGENVILLGGPNREVPVEELASKAGTISYELFCLIGRHALKIYRD